MRGLALLALLAMVGGCIETAPGDGPAGAATSPSASPSTTVPPDCRERLGVAMADRVVVLTVRLQGGLGPHGPVEGPWVNGTLDVERDGRHAGSATTDGHGCAQHSLGEAGRYVVRARPAGSCTPDGEGILDDDGVAGADLRVVLSLPCA